MLRIGPPSLLAEVDSRPPAPSAAGGRRRPVAPRQPAPLRRPVPPRPLIHVRTEAVFWWRRLAAAAVVVVAVGVPVALARQLHRALSVSVRLTADAVVGGTRGGVPGPAALVLRATVTPPARLGAAHLLVDGHAVGARRQAGTLVWRPADLVSGPHRAVVAVSRGLLPPARKTITFIVEPVPRAG